MAKITEQRYINSNVLVDLRRINLKVNLLCFGSIGLERAGHAIVETHAEGQQQIGFLNRVVHPCFSVHSHHSQVEGMRGRQASDSQQRHGHGNSGALREFAQLVHCVGQQNAMPGENDWALRRTDHVQCQSILTGIDVLLAIRNWERHVTLPIEFAG